VRRVNMGKKNESQWCAFGKMGRMCVQLKDRRSARRCTRGVEYGRVSVRETGCVVNHRRNWYVRSR
jgi:hypothetical protein